MSLGLAAGATLVSVHNVAHMQQVTYRMRCAIRNGRFSEFVQEFMLEQYPTRDYPSWIRDALAHVEITLL